MLGNRKQHKARPKSSANKSVSESVSSSKNTKTSQVSKKSKKQASLSMKERLEPTEIDAFDVGVRKSVVYVGLE